jgi:hypothetical protein
MLSLNYTLLQAVADQALIDAAAHPRWVAAIGRALVELDTNPWVARAPEGHGLIIGSPSGTCYSSNGICQCKAFEFKTPCWHRAAARLVRLHDERQQAAQQPQQAARAPLGERLAAARLATSKLNELFA